ncbi:MULTISPECIES: hypothetical protein [Chryseobacterium]|nr:MULTISPECIES: hypothetical protein [Chryseobacterium]UCA61217.1 hypothetical protein KB553_06710 [Chryseobacterium rhizoplanae]
MKKLNPGYFEFFFFRYGVIVIFILLTAMLIYFFGKEKDPAPLACISIGCFLFLLFMCMAEYKMLKTKLPPANVFLTNDSLIINEITYPAEQIRQITYMPVKNTPYKFEAYCFEIKTNNGTVFYFLDKSRNWKLESPTMKLLQKHPVFSLKTKEITHIKG